MARKILIIDDDPVIVQYLETLLADNGYDTRSAANGEEGVRALENGDIGLITLDLDMPNVYGTRFYRVLQKSPEYQHIPVIVISGIARAELAIRKAVATLHKPFDKDVLLDLVRRHLPIPEARI